MRLNYVYVSINSFERDTSGRKESPEMTMQPRLLFPDLPPELRNQIYQHLSAYDNALAATTSGLPLQLKKYECKHTTVQMCPVHYSSDGLLALEKYGFQEAREYRSWLLHNAVELRIGVVFTGRVNTFVQADWDAKMALHLRKLAKQHAWLTKVSQYDIQMLFASRDGPLKSKKNKRVAAHIPRDMVKTLTQLMDKRIATHRGYVNAALSLDYSLALQNTLSPIKFGVAAFFSPFSTDALPLKTLVKTVSVLPCPDTHQSSPASTRLIPLPTPRENKDMLSLKGTRMSCIPARIGHLVMSKTYILDSVLNDHVATTAAVVGDTPRDDDDTRSAFVFRELVHECLGQR